MADTNFQPFDSKDEIVKDALNHIANGKSLKSFADQRNLDYAMVYRLIEARTGEHNSLALAREIGTNAMADEALDLLATTDSENATAVKVRVDGMLRLAGLWNRKQFGQQTNVALEVTHKPDLSGFSDDEMQVIARALAQQGKLASQES